MNADEIKNCTTCKYNVNYLENGIGECKKNPNHFGGYPPEYDICDKYEIDYNTAVQNYKDIKLMLITRKSYNYQKAKRFLIIANSANALTNQNLWIPNVYLLLDGTIKKNANLDFIIRKSKNQLKLAGYYSPITPNNPNGEVKE